ncbi:unnamed protein product [Caenorhabditis sp. 36 PRJEB53466]|nr:unnamed protein product [Caenorhabditis sp. 36 PRJEB53466]
MSGILPTPMDVEDPQTPDFPDVTQDFPNVKPDFSDVTQHFDPTTKLFLCLAPNKVDFSCAKFAGTVSARRVDKSVSLPNCRDATHMQHAHKNRRV